MMQTSFFYIGNKPLRHTIFVKGDYDDEKS